ncbi:CBS domain-containing protein [Pedobacter antarcticus]|uniref:CBS domain-containing protein n=1 Tax=Pedobacter antarcticus TaxID=34086 RepID=UPI001C59A8BB|nr:CBS domain-containing protein [Pedobacter antarcticus]
MTAAELISNLILPLQTTDTVQTAQERMTEFKVTQLPVLREGQFCGLIREEQLLHPAEDLITTLEKELLQVFVSEGVHIYELIMLMNKLQVDLLPVLDGNQQYLGVVSFQELLPAVSAMFALRDPGGIIVLEISNRNNSLAHMAQIVEADNAQILSSYVQDFPDSTRLEVTLKINKTELSGIIASFERYNYLVKAVYNGTVADNGTADRYNLLMSYLNV